MDIDKVDVKHEHGKAVACNGVPIFDGYGGVMSVEDAERLEESWEKAENYAMDHESLDAKIESARVLGGSGRGGNRVPKAKSEVVR